MYNNQRSCQITNHQLLFFRFCFSIQDQALNSDNQTEGSAPKSTEECNQLTPTCISTATATQVKLSDVVKSDNTNITSSKDCLNVTPGSKVKQNVSSLESNSSKSNSIKHATEGLTSGALTNPVLLKPFNTDSTKVTSKSMKDNSMLKTKGAFNSSKVQKGKQLVQVKKKGFQMTAQLSRMLKHDKTKTVKNSETSLTDFLSNL